MARKLDFGNTHGQTLHPQKSNFLAYTIQPIVRTTVKTVMNQVPINVPFRRALTEDKWMAWLNLVAKIDNVQLSKERDIFNQGLHNHGHFSVRSMYAYMTNQGTLFTNKFIWKLKLPLKIKIFLWYRQRGVILTKDNLAKRNWTSSQKFCFCYHNATITHLFYCCHVKTIWNIVHIATGLTPPRSTTHMLGGWLTGMGREDKKHNFMGAATII